MSDTLTTSINRMALFKANERLFDVQDEPQATLLPIDGYEDMPLLPLTTAVENLETIVPKAVQNARFARQRCIAPGDGLSQDESASIHLLTMEWKPKDQSLYIQLNAALRSDDRLELVSFFFYLKLLLSALCKLESVKKTVWRGVKADLTVQYPVGKSFVWRGFNSCTESLDLLQSDTFLGKRGVRTLFCIECQTGKAIHDHSYYKCESEIVLLPGTQLQVVGHRDLGHGLRIIYLKETKPTLLLIQSSFTSPSAIFSIPTSRIDLKAGLSTSDTNLLFSPREMPNNGRFYDSNFRSKSANDILKSYRNKLLTELMQRERKKESIRFPRQSFNVADMHLIAHELTSNKCWTILYLWDTQMEKNHLDILMHSFKSNSTVMCLSLDSNQLSDDGTSVLARVLKTNINLRTIHLNSNKITELAGEELADMLHVNKTLTHLELASNLIGDGGVSTIARALKTNTGLRTICLNDNQVTEIGAQQLADMLQVNRTLTSLNLSSNPLGDDGVTAIARALRQNVTLQKLSLSETGMTTTAIQELSEMLEINQTLEVLRLNSNDLGDEGVMIIARALFQNRTLTLLDLSTNYITHVGADQIALVLRETQSALTTLDLNNNPLGDFGVTSISRALIKNTTLTKLKLDSIDMTIDGARELANMMRVNNHLLYLALSKNHIDDDAMNLYADALQHNNRLQYLYLNDNTLTDQCVSGIVAALEKNQTLSSIELVKNQLTEEAKSIIRQAAETNKICSVYLDFTFQRTFSNHRSIR